MRRSVFEVDEHTCWIVGPAVVAVKMADATIHLVFRLEPV
jgi:hypothetical protein